IFIISGYVSSPHPNIPNIISLRPMFIGIDTLFNEKWVLEFGLEDNMKGTAHTSIPINDSLFMGVGRYRYSDSTVMTMDAWAMFYNDKGQQTGYKRITRDKLGYEATESTFYEIERINDSVYISTAGFLSAEYDEYAVGEIVFDTSGTVYNYEMRIGSPATGYLTKTFDNKYVIASSYRYPSSSWDMLLYKINQNLEHDTLYPSNYTYDSLCRHTIESGVIDLAGCDVVTSIGEVPTLEEYNEKLQSIPIKASPNPSATGEILLEMENTGLHHNMKLVCIDVFGKKVLEEKVYQYQGESRISTLHWQHGMFVAIIYSNGRIAGKTKFIVN
ncbi:MAG: hypothetical protein GY705_22640, partial [Bacteroidetes bacterium]|nr:hypothetical protein [Bacteroidota bacterium]